MLTRNIYVAKDGQEKLGNSSAINSVDVRANQDGSSAKILDDAAPSCASRSDAKAVALYKFNGRLAQFRFMGEHREYWEERWAQGRIRELLTAAGSGRLEEFEDLFTHYLPRDLPVLEAGCGRGHLVMALDRRGY